MSRAVRLIREAMVSIAKRPQKNPNLTRVAQDYLRRAELSQVSSKPVALAISPDVQKILRLEEVRMALLQQVEEDQAVQALRLSRQRLERLLEESIEVIDVKADIVCLGYGNMASALLGEQEVEALVTKERSNTENTTFYTSPKDLPKEARFMVVCVKPGQIKAVFENLQTTPDVLISLAAGTPIDVLSHHFPGGLDKSKIVRTMPNTPCSVNSGVIGVLLQPDQKHLQSQIEEMFGKEGNKIVYVTTEDQIDKLTALSGSGPAYFFLLAKDMAAKGLPDINEKSIFSIMEELPQDLDYIANYKPKRQWPGNLKNCISMVDSREDVSDLLLSFVSAMYKNAVDMGFSRSDALILSKDVAVGAGAYGLSSSDNAQTLKENVTSKGGTTAAALVAAGEDVGEKTPGPSYKMSEATTLDGLVSDMIGAAYKRANEISITALTNIGITPSPVASGTASRSPNSLVTNGFCNGH
jgi:pyrroline-5-carboxylate reductase